MKSFLVRIAALLSLAATSLSADTVELLPGKITGAISVANETVAGGSISAYATDGSGAFGSASFTGNSYSLVVPAGKTWQLNVYVTLSLPNNAYGAISTSLPDQIAVAASQTVTHDVSIQSARLNASVTVQNGTLTQVASLQANGNDGSTNFSASSQNAPYVPVIPMASISVYGTASVTNTSNQSTTRPLPNQQVSVGAGGATASWTIDAAFAAGTFSGSYDLQGPVAFNNTYTYVYDANWSYLGATPSNPFEFDNLPEGTVHSYALAYLPDGYLQFAGDFAITAGNVTNTVFGGAEGFVTTPLQLTGFLTSANLSSGQLSSYNSTTNQAWASTNLNSAGNFVSTLTPGNWIFNNAYVNAVDFSVPGNYYYSQIGINDYSGSGVLVSGGSSTTRSALALDTTEAEFTFDVVEPAGAASETQIQNPYIQGSLNRIGTDGSYLGSYSIYAANYGNAQAKPRVRVIAPPGTYDFYAYGTVEGSQTSFGHFQISLEKPLQTPTGTNVSVNPGNGVSLVFGDITGAGVTTASQLPVGPALPAGYTDLTNNGSNVFYSVSTSASYSGNVSVTLTYNDGAVPESDQSNLHLFYYDQSSQTWSDITGSVDTQNNTITGTAPGVGLYAVATKDKSKDTTAPVITAANITVEATSASGAAATFSPTATDDTDGAETVTTSIASGSIFPLGTTTVTATATDAAGNVGTATFNVTVQDKTAPTILGTPWVHETFASYSGNESSLQYQSGLQVAYAGAMSGWNATGFHAVHAVDRTGAGNWAIMIWNDNVITQSAGVAANASGASYTVAFVASPAVYAAPSQVTSASDGLVVDVLRADDTVLASYTAQPGAWAGNVSFSGYSFSYTGDGSGPVRLRVRSLAAGDERFGGAIDDIVIADTTEANQTLEATSAAGAPATFTATAIDRVSGYTVVTASPASGSTFPLGASTVTLSSTDAAGNTGASTFDVVVKDTTAPVITAPANIVTEATSAAGAVVTFSASAKDTVDGAVAVTSDIASGSTFPVGTTVVTLTATDSHSNTSHAVFSVTVHDTTAPVIASQDNLVLEATGPNGAVATFTPSATDIVSGAVTVLASPKSGSVFPIGTSTVTLTASDAAANTATSTFTVTVRDTTPPEISGPGNLSAEATSAAGAVVTFSASATDIVDGAVAVTASPASGSTFPLGATTVTLTSTDAHANTSTSTFTVTVKDTTAPKLTVPANLTLEATSAAGAVATFSANATDAVTASPVIGYSKASGSTFALGTTTVNVTATDGASNVSKGSFTVTVVDTTAPALAIPANQVLEATSPAGASASFAASATDAVTASPTIAYSIAPGSTFAVGTTTVNVSATDGGGNVAKGSFTITVRDTIAPKLTVPANLTLEATSLAGAVANFAASATDAVTTSPTIAYSAAPGTTFAIGTTTVNVTATDAAGNKSTGSFTVTVRDSTAPVISSLSASPGTIWSPNKKMVPVTLSVGTTDAVGVTSAKIVSVTTNEPDGTTQWEITGNLTLNLKADRLGTGNGRLYTITVEVSDAAGNATRKTVTVDVPHDQR